MYRTLQRVSRAFVLIIYTLYIGTNLKHSLSHTLRATCGTFLTMRTNSILTPCLQGAVHFFPAQFAIKIHLSSYEKVPHLARCGTVLSMRTNSFLYLSSRTTSNCREPQSVATSRLRRNPQGRGRLCRPRGCAWGETAL